MQDLYLYRDVEWGRKDPLSIPEEEQQQETETGEVIVCRQCGHPVTERRNKLVVNGGHLHTFFNPAGIIYEIGCFGRAPGCWVHGPASIEFAWFPGFTWRLALCDNCTTHLGWFFASEDSTFFGLILKKLAYTS